MSSIHSISNSSFTSFFELSSHECDACGKVFPSKSSLKMHSFTHSGERPYSCKECGILICSVNSQNPDPIDLHVCNICNKSFAAKKHLDRHYNIHTGEKPFACTVCDKTFTRKDNLQVHMKRHEGCRPFAYIKSPSIHLCWDFPFAFLHDQHIFEMSEFTIDVSSDSYNVPGTFYACDICQKQFSAKSFLNRHYLIHTGEKPFKCGKCGKSFAQKGNLMRHLKSHQGIKPFKCVPFIPLMFQILVLTPSFISVIFVTNNFRSNPLSMCTCVVTLENVHLLVKYVAKISLKEETLTCT
ncbi:endothelial zinc finger protein induced by tumor necrosis factor alpha [Parasteatoda tepidariorum]|uniref:endothelial zinc finger protein induced by tumor necrosis factor alpha n=1 Tax=Parasteatoda tepidariorum TaxID=114398 RepID=UPI0039BD4EE1